MKLADIFNVDTESLKVNAGIVAKGGVSFATQALQLLSDIRDNTGVTRSDRRTFNIVTTTTGAVDAFRAQPGSTIVIRNVAVLHASSQNARILVNGNMVFASEEQAVCTGCTIYIPAGSVVQVESYTADQSEWSIQYEVVTIPAVYDAWTIQTRDIDNIGTMATDHSRPEDKA